MPELKIRNGDEEIEIVAPMGNCGHCITVSQYISDTSEVPYDYSIIFLKPGQAKLIAEFLMEGVNGCQKD